MRERCPPSFVRSRCCANPAGCPSHEGLSMLCPEVLPDEFAPGYLGRVARFNGISSKSDATRYLKAMVGVPGESLHTFPLTCLLARVSGLTTEQFCVSHTLLPLQRSIADTWDDLPHGSREHTNILWTQPLRQLRVGAYLCAECIREDVQFRGLSYWRRSHQVPGRYWCPKHGGPLRTCASAQALFVQPKAALAESQAVDGSWVCSLRRTADVQRYLDVCDDFLDSRRPIGTRYASRAIRTRSEQMGFHYGKGAQKGKLLSEVLIEKFDGT